MTRVAHVEVEGRDLRLSNLDKVLYPQSGFTKGHVVDYYMRIASTVLPHLHNRPLTLKRYPSGVEGEFFYEKQCPSHKPHWLQIATVESERNKRGLINYCVANDLPSLIWVANLASLELHVLLARYENLTCPTMMVFDLDPGPPADLLDCLRIAFKLRKLLEHLNLHCFAKTSGGKGLHLYVPLNTPTSYDETKSFSRALAEHLEREHPDEVTSNMRKDLRGGKIFLDWSQNDEHKTTVCVYSLRARQRPTVSAPVSWDEIETAQKKKDPSRLIFETQQVLQRVERLGDLFEPVLTMKQKLSGSP